MKLIYKAIILLFALTLSVSAMAQATSSNSEQGVSAKIEKQTIKVKGATCKTDLGMIVTNIEKIEGVKSCTIVKSGAISTLDIEYIAGLVDLDAIKNTVESTGTCKNPNARRYKVKT